VPLRDLVGRIRRASHRSPRYIVHRLTGMAAERLRRPWSSAYPRLLTAQRIAAAAGVPSVDALWEQLGRAPFFLHHTDRQAWTTAFRARYPERDAAVIAAADAICRHEFDLLGSGCVTLGAQLPWHTDFKTGREWSRQYSPDIDYAELDRPTDVKVPWELSRCQHFTTLGQAYWLTDDERYAREFVSEVADWIDANPWGYGVNWACAMDVALRAVSWMWGFYFMSESAACAAPAFRSAFVHALHLHGDHIATHIERSDVNGNHYLCDAVGLVFIGSFFRSTAKGRRWLATGRDMIAAEIFNQTSADGVDFEKSTAYHRLVLEAFITCGVLADRQGEPFPSEWQARLDRMLEFVEAYVKPDGSIPLVGDADDGRIQKLGTQLVNDHRYLLAAGAVFFGRADFKRAATQFGDEAFWLLGVEGAAAFDAVAESEAPPIASRAFPDGGFYVLRSDRAHVFVDCGEVGMHGRGGHGHNDILSFELWLDGTNLITDCGAYLYTASREWRNRFRSTAFHNVVQVDDEELNRLISPDHLWQLRDDARPQDVEWRPGETVDYFRGSHTGYRRLTPPVSVTREVGLIKKGPEVVIRDTVAGTGTRQLAWRFHVAPAVTAAIVGDDVCLSSGGRDAWLQVVSRPHGMTTMLEDGWVSPSYGVRSAIRVAVLRGRFALPATAEFRFGVDRMPAERLRELAAMMPSDTSAPMVRT
jgi:hypothetical protein